MDTFLGIVSRREIRSYRDEPIGEETIRRIVDAGRLAGSARNRQPWRFIVLEDAQLIQRVADTVYAPGNVLGAGVVIVICVRGRGPVAFDAGRAAQNMMLAAWNEGVGSCPNGMPDPDRTGSLLDLFDDERPQVVLSFGLPRHAHDPLKRSPQEWISRADRKPFDEVVKRL